MENIKHKRYDTFNKIEPTEDSDYIFSIWRLIRKIKKPFKIVAYGIAKRWPWFRKLLRNTLYSRRLGRFKRRSRGIVTDEKLILFESFKGKSYACSPRALFEYMVDAPEFEGYRFVWSFKKPSRHRYMEEEYRNTEIIKTYGRTYEQTLAKAKYWITNYRVLDHIYPGKDQVYVQCWHGTPLKRLGYDLDHSDNAMNSTDEIWDKYKIDAEKFTWMISPSSFATEKFKSAWNLKEFGREDVIIEEGYPRNDILTNYDEELKDFTKECIGISDMGEKKIILYAPTWRDNQHVAGLGYTYDMHLDLDRLQRELGEDYILLCRLHYLVANSIDFEKYEGFIYDVSKYDDINELYIISDLLITDYSSVFFDYANLKKPILFYMYDLEEYRDDIRGFYIDINELPGEIITEEDRLIQAVKEVGDGFVPDEKYMAFNSRYNYLDDGNAAKRTARKICGKGNDNND